MLPPLDSTPPAGNVSVNWPTSCVVPGRWERSGSSFREAIARPGHDCSVDSDLETTPTGRFVMMPSS